MEKREGEKKGGKKHVFPHSSIRSTQRRLAKLVITASPCNTRALLRAARCSVTLKHYKLYYTVQISDSTLPPVVVALRWEAANGYRAFMTTQAADTLQRYSQTRNLALTDSLRVFSSVHSPRCNGKGVSSVVYNNNKKKFSRMNSVL